MAKKKSVKQSRKKKVSRRSNIKKSRSSSKNLVGATKNKMSVIIKNLVMFIILFVASLGLYSISSEELYSNLFLLLSIIFGFITISFLLVLLIFVFFRILKK